MNTLRIIYNVEEQLVNIRARGVGQDYETFWDAVNRLPEEYFITESSWMDFPWSGFQMPVLIGKEFVAILQQEFPNSVSDDS